MRPLIVLFLCIVTLGCKEKLQTTILVDFVGQSDGKPAKHIKATLEKRDFSDQSLQRFKELQSDENGTIKAVYELDRNTKNGFYFLRIMGNADYAGIEADIPIIPGRTNYLNYKLPQRMEVPIRFKHIDGSPHGVPVNGTVFQDIPNAASNNSFILDLKKSTDSLLYFKLVLEKAATVMLYNSKTNVTEKRVIFIDNLDEKVISY